MKIITTIQSDLSRRGVGQLVEAVRNDANTRCVLLQLTDNGAAWEIPSGVTAAVAFRKPDGHKGLYDTLPDGSAAVTMAGSTVTAVLAPQVLTCAGDAAAAVVLFDKNLNRLATFPFAVSVSPDPSGGSAVSNDYYRYSTMESVSEAVEAALASLEDFLSTAEEALSAVRDASAEAAPAVSCEATGDTVAVTDASSRLLQGLTLYGRTTQTGTPSPAAPAALVNAGEGGSIGVTVAGKNLFGFEAATFTQRKAVTLDVPLPPGTYAVSAVCTSDDPNKSNCIATFLNRDNTSRKTLTFARNIRDTETLTADFPIAEIWFMSSESYNSSAGYTATWAQVQMEAGAAATAYEPYTGQKLTVSTPGGLPGIPVASGGNYTDESGQAWVCDEIDLARGVRVHRVGGGSLTEITTWVPQVNLGSHTRFAANIPENWYRNTGTSYLFDNSKGLFTHCKYLERYSEDTAHAFTVDNLIYLYLPNELATTREDVNAWIAAQEAAGTPVNIMVALDPENAAETPLTAEEVAAFAVLHSNKPNTTACNDGAAGMKLAYAADTKAYIDNQFTALRNAILSAGANL